MRQLFVVAIVVACLSPAQAQPLKFECTYKYPTGHATIRLIEIDPSKKEASMSVLNPTRSFGPFPATVTPQTVVWHETFKNGRAASATAYTFDRIKKTLNIHIIYNDFMDQDPWDQTSPCK